MSERPWQTALLPEVLSGIQAGVMRTRYRGRSLLKNPFDLVVYLQLLQQLRPGTVVEIGSKMGGSALWFADMMTLHGIDAHVVSVDLQPPSGIDDARIEFLQGDALRLQETLDAGRCAQWKRPLLVIEDSAHYYDTTLAAMRFFDPLLQRGDFLVVEDGVVAFLPGAAYRAYDDGPNRAVRTFLADSGDRYEVVPELCDWFGYNVTYCPNSWLRRR